MKRFYKDVGIARSGDGFAVHLDGKPVKTPARATLVLPTKALAEAIAEEWRGQGDSLDMADMPLTRLAFTAVDTVPAQRAAMTEQLLGYGRTDLVSYRAEAPRSLVARQASAWDPLLQWLADTHDAALAVTAGIRHVPQPGESITALEHAIGALDAYELSALHAATTATGSLTIALALLGGRIDAAQAFIAAHVDEHFQAEQWGHDADAEARRARLRSELETAERFLKLL